MKTKPIPQLGAAMALVELVKEADAAGLPPVAWQIGMYENALDGSLHTTERPLDAIAAYARLLGGEVMAHHDYEFAGQTRRSYWVSVVWRDVEVLVTVGVPVAARTAVAV